MNYIQILNYYTVRNEEFKFFDYEGKVKYCTNSLLCSCKTYTEYMIFLKHSNINVMIPCSIYIESNIQIKSIDDFVFYLKNTFKLVYSRLA